MNKPVFDQVAGEAINVGDVIDETFVDGVLDVLVEEEDTQQGDKRAEGVGQALVAARGASASSDVVSEADSSDVAAEVPIGSGRVLDYRSEFPNLSSIVSSIHSSGEASQKADHYPAFAPLAMKTQVQLPPAPFIAESAPAALQARKVEPAQQPIKASSVMSEAAEPGTSTGRMAMTGSMSDSSTEDFGTLALGAISLSGSTAVDRITNEVAYDQSALYIGNLATSGAKGQLTWSANSASFEVRNGNQLYATNLNYEALASQNWRVSVQIEAFDPIGGTGGEPATTSTTFNFTVKNVLEAPSNLQWFNGGSVDENSPNNTTIGNLRATSNEGTNVVWSLIGSSHTGAIGVDSSGWVYVADRTKLNYEVSTPYTIIVRATTAGSDGFGSTYTDQTFTINVRDINEAPTNPSVASGPLKLTENLAGDYAVATVQSLDPDNAISQRQTTTYSLLNDMDGRFTINAQTGEIMARGGTGNRFDFEALAAVDPNLSAPDANGKRYYTLQVKATDNGSPVLSSGVSSIKIELEDLNEKPNVPTLVSSVGSISENYGTGSYVAQVTATDPDNAYAQRQTLTYELVDDLGGRFAIRSSDGLITVKSGGLLDYEASSAADPYLKGTPGGVRYYELYVRAKDDATNTMTSDPLKVVIYLTDINEKPTAPVVQAGSLLHFSENLATNAIVATVKSTDPDIYATPPQTLTYSLVDSLGGRFTVDGSGNIIALASGSFNFEANSVSDPYLNIQTINGVTKRFYYVQVKATDNGAGNLSSNITTVQVELDDVNEKPFAPSVQPGSTQHFEENLTANRIVAAVKSTDPDIYANPAQTITYSLVSTLGGRFTIDASGNIYAVGNKSFNFEADTASDPFLQKHTDSNGVTTRWYEVQVRASDGNLTSDITTVRIDLDDVNEAPSISFSQAPVSSILENPAPGDLIAKVTGTDPDIFANQPLTYSLLDTLGGRFKINALTGDIIVDAAHLIDYEATNDPYLSPPDAQGRRSYTLQVKVSDGRLSSQVLTISFQVEDRPEAPNAPIIVGGTVNSVNENVQDNPVVATMSATDPDAGRSTIRYNLIDDLGGRFAIDEFSGMITVRNGGLINHESEREDPYLYEPDATGKRYYLLQVTATDDTSLTSVPTTVKVYVNDVNEAPTATYAPVGGIAVGTQIDTVVATVTISDPDTRPTFRDFHYQLVADASGTTVYAGTDFRVDAGGNIVVNGALTAGTKTLWVRITDGTGPDANTIVQAVAIQVDSEVTNTPPEDPIVVGGDSGVLHLIDDQAYTEGFGVEVAQAYSDDDGLGGL
ncbi:cadherin repeat domain-containing protein [Microvirga lotononidis]|uniref:Cadherin domain-containing protein n=1 Tax=Microvirga lotononidis TaxID=864069 RepID=I4YP92_9HYPH|nr:cadherin repeat domain-containing protein [Microvirga lotononidis]EIM25784.1 Cadherin domain-containing protein [Microvirga lotononidis]WQO25707.1 cadherin repeat domain-containing protein [Microvirga lotononidis]